MSGSLRRIGSSGADSMIGSAFADTIEGVDGSDTLNGIDGNDLLLGGSGVDLLLGGAGNDTLDGGAGTNTMTGGAGIDHFLISGGGDRITDLGFGGADVLQITAGAEVYARLASAWTATPATSNMGVAHINANGFNVNLSQAVGNSGWTISNSAGEFQQFDRGEGTAITETVVGLPSGSQARTYSAWVSTTNTHPGEVLVSQGSLWAYGKSSLMLNFSGTGTIAWDFQVGAVYSEPTNILDGAPHLIVAVFHPVEGVQLYLDGVALSTQTWNGFNPGAVATVNVESGVTFGGENFGSEGGAAFTGGMANAEVWDVALTSQEVLALYQGQPLSSQPVVSKFQADVGGFKSVSLVGSAASDTITGGTRDDTLSGLAGDDRLDGGTGADTMWGGEGNDIYVVDHTGDRITELSRSGSDRVESSISYALGAELESLLLTGASHINGVGNSLSNQITGNSGNNCVEGGLGEDTLLGGAGADTLLGGAGNDQLTGGSGNDVFRFSSYSDSGDIIRDFVRGQDRIDLSAIDANATLVGDQAFEFRGVKDSFAFTPPSGDLLFGITATKATVVYSYNLYSDTTTIEIDSTDARADADMVIYLAGRVQLQASDFVL